MKREYVLRKTSTGKFHPRQDKAAYYPCGLMVLLYYPCGLMVLLKDKIVRYPIYVPDKPLYPETEDTIQALIDQGKVCKHCLKALERQGKDPLKVIRLRAK